MNTEGHHRTSVKVYIRLCRCSSAVNAPNNRYTTYIREINTVLSLNSFRAFTTSDEKAIISISNNAALWAAAIPRMENIECTTKSAEIMYSLPFI
jgi:hypothetical protein